MRKTWFLLFAILLVPTFPETARAQAGARAIEIEPFVGPIFFDEDIFLDNGIGFGGRLGYWFTDRLTLEGSFAYFPSIDPDFPNIDEDELDDDIELPQTDLWLAQGNLTYALVPLGGKFNPFLTAGGGMAGRKVEFTEFDAETDTETDGAANAGIGNRLYFNEGRTIALRTDIVAQWIFQTIPNQDPDEPEDESDARTTVNFRLATGLSFLL